MPNTYEYEVYPKPNASKFTVVYLSKYYDLSSAVWKYLLIGETYKKKSLKHCPFSI